MCQQLRNLAEKKRDAEKKYNEAIDAARGLAQEEFVAALERLQMCKEEMYAAERAWNDHKANHGCNDIAVNVRFVAHLGA
jgi:hypothetical protein